MENNITEYSPQQFKTLVKWRATGLLEGLDIFDAIKCAELLDLGSAILISRAKENVNIEFTAGVFLKGIRRKFKEKPPQFDIEIYAENFFKLEAGCEKYFKSHRAIQDQLRSLYPDKWSLHFGLFDYEGKWLDDNIASINCF